MMSKKWLALAALVVVGIVVWLSSSGPSWDEEVSFRGLALQGRNLELPDGETVTLARGTIKVPEVRSKPGSRMIDIGFVTLKGKRDTDSIPLFMVAGGPGGSHISRLDSEFVQDMMTLFRELGDVVLVDLRGINSSQPNFVEGGIDNSFRTVKSAADFSNLLRDNGIAGRRALVEASFDLDGYVITEAAADLIAVADALGYDKINLQGTSFGSHFVFTTVRDYPDRINRFLVSGVEAYDHTYDDGVAKLEAVQKIAEEASEVWAGAYGVDNPLLALQALAERAAANPEDVYGLQSHEIIGSFVSSQRLFGGGYHLGNRRSMVSWPAEVARLHEGEGVWQTKLLRHLIGPVSGFFTGTAAAGLFDCSSGISKQRRLTLLATAPKPFPSDFDTMDPLCEGWGIPPLPESFQLSPGNDVVGLFVHGTYDTSTPYANALEVLDMFPNGNLVTVHGGSHGALYEAIKQGPQFKDQLLSWFRGGESPVDITLGPIEFDPMPD